MVATPIVKLKDGVTAGLSKISSKLKSLAKAAIPITVAATVTTAALGGVVSSGMQLENQQVSMKHFIGATNKGLDDAGVQKIADEFTQQLRENANATPFETGEVIAAGSRAVSIANGDTKEAMSLVKLAEDMAAASGGTKTISDAIEALADAKMGETERLKEFGFKVSAEEFEQKGFQGVSNDLQSFFGGAAEKLATTGSGLISTIKGKLKSNIADMGLKIVDKLKPALSGIITLIDTAAPAFEAFGTGLAEKIGSGIEAITAFIPRLTSGFKAIQPTLSSFGASMMGTLQQVSAAVMPAVNSIMQTVQTVLPAILPVIQTVVNTIGQVISAAAPVIAGLVQGIGTVISTLAPVFQVIFDGIGQKVGSVLSFIGSKMGWIQEIIGTVMPVVADILTSAWSVISPIIDIAISVFKVLFNVVQTVFNGIASVISSVWDKIKPVVEGIGNGLSWIADKVGGLFGFGGGGGGETGSNAEGTNNWRGGPTWVGEQGPELIDLPRGTRLLPNKESVQLASSLQRMRAATAAQNAPSPVPANAPIRRGGSSSSAASVIQITLTKLADSIMVREEADIDKIGEKVAKEVVLAVKNMVPAPT